MLKIFIILLVFGVLKCYEKILCFNIKKWNIFLWVEIYLETFYKILFWWSSDFKVLFVIILDSLGVRLG